MRNTPATAIQIATRLAAALTVALSTPALAETTPVSGLAAHTHIHGIAVDRQDPSYLFIAAHHGLYRAGPDGSAELVSVVQDFMGFNPHPSEPGLLFASGHPAGGGNLGFIGSSDGGKTWTEISPGLNGPVDFHQMTVSPADPQTIYGAYGVLQVSRDGGKTWAIAGPVPDRLIDLGASAKNADTLYAAKEDGLSVSLDSGLTWKPLIENAPVTMVETTPGDAIYAFVFGEGLKMAQEGVFDFVTISDDWGEKYVLHFAADPTDSNRLYAATGENEVLASTDGGKSWTPFGK